MDQMCANNEPVENGNNESFSTNGCISYDAVINNYTDTEYFEVCQSIQKYCVKAIVGKEIGKEKGTPHLQIYIRMKKKVRFTTITRTWNGFERATLRPTRNEKALIEYCKKDGNIFSVGFPKPVKIITNLRPWQKNIEELFLTEPDDRTIHWFWEPDGNIGKSAFTKYMVVKHGAIFCDGGKKSDLINLVFNANMDSCKCIIWDLPRSSRGHISYSTLESVKNGIVCNTKYETGVKTFNSPHIFVFSNFPPDDLEQLSMDRWNVTRL